MVYGRLYRNLRFMMPTEQARDIEQGEVEPGQRRKRNCISRRVFVLVSAVNTTWRVTPALYLFLEQVKRIHSRETNTGARRRQTVTESLKLTPFTFYSFCYATILRAFVTRYARLLRQYHVVLPQECSIGYTFVLHVYIRRCIVLYGAFCKGSSYVSIQFSQYSLRVVQTRIEHGR